MLSVSAPCSLTAVHSAVLCVALLLAAEAVTALGPQPQALRGYQLHAPASAQSGPGVVVETLRFTIPCTRVPAFVTADHEVWRLDVLVDAGVSLMCDATSVAASALSFGCTQRRLLCVCVWLDGALCQVWTKYLQGTAPFLFKQVWSNPEQAVSAAVCTHSHALLCYKSHIHACGLPGRVMPTVRCGASFTGGRGRRGRRFPRRRSTRCRRLSSQRTAATPLRLSCPQRKAMTLSTRPVPASMTRRLQWLKCCSSTCRVPMCPPLCARTIRYELPTRRNVRRAARARPCTDHRELPHAVAV